MVKYTHVVLRLTMTKCFFKNVIFFKLFMYRDDNFCQIARSLNVFTFSSLIEVTLRDVSADLMIWRRLHSRLQLTGNTFCHVSQRQIASGRRKHVCHMVDVIRRC